MILIRAASAVGLPVWEAKATIASGVKAGQQKPRLLPERDPVSQYVQKEEAPIDIKPGGNLYKFFNPDTKIKHPFTSLSGEGGRGRMDQRPSLKVIIQYLKVIQAP